MREPLPEGRLGAVPSGVVTTATREEAAPAAAQGGWPRWVLPALLIGVFLLIGGPLSSQGGKLSEVQRNDSAAYLPAGAEATEALAASKRFTGLEATPAIVVYTRPSGITADDRVQIVLAALAMANQLSPRLAAPPMGPIISDVLVLGAGTDYALLLTARYREELRRTEDRYDAMRVAWRAAVQPVVASGGTVILGLLCLLASNLASTRGLGPVSAIGIACALVSMLVLLPAVLVLVGRTAFWPFRPTSGTGPAQASGTGPAQASGTGPAQAGETGPAQASGTGPAQAGETRPAPASRTGPAQAGETGPARAGAGAGGGARRGRGVGRRAPLARGRT